MELTYIIVAAVIIVLPFVLSRLFSGSTRDTKTVLGASRAAPKKQPASLGNNTLTKAVREQRTSDGNHMLTDEIKGLLAEGKKVEAIQLARAKTGFPLEAAKDMVEMIEKAGMATPQAVSQGAPKTPSEKMSITSFIKLAREVAPEVQRLAKAGQKVEAIKLIRDHTGMGLKEAKDIVDKLG